MDFMSFDEKGLYPDELGYSLQQERKIQSPEVEQNCGSQENMVPSQATSSSLEISSGDMAVINKAKCRKARNTPVPNSNRKTGHWSLDENKRYHWFLELHHQHFFEKHLRRTDRIFKGMANFVQTREAEQCRSHHQKMEKKYKVFSKIIMSLRLQHYGSEEHEPIWNDMCLSGHQIQEGSFVTMDQLRQYQMRNIQNSNEGANERICHRLSQNTLTPKTEAGNFDREGESIYSVLDNFHQLQSAQLSEEQKEVAENHDWRDFTVDEMFKDTYEDKIMFGELF